MTTPEDLAGMFLANAAKAAAGTHRAENADELGATLAGILSAGAPVYCPGATESERAALSALPRRVPDYASAPVCVEEAAGGIAETGTIVCTSAGGRAVQAGLLPSHHVAIVPRKKIFSTLDDFFASCAAVPPTNVTLVTGPSRTADIELTLAIGVHGPEKLDIVVTGG
jgi:L-lactate dehydrogenase complex protein LldG